MTFEESNRNIQKGEQVENESDGELSSNKVSDDELENNAWQDGDTDISSLNVGWADAVAKILRTKKPKGKKTLILSKAKKINDVRKEKPKEVGFQIDGEVKEEKPDPLLVLDEISNGLVEPNRKRKRELPTVRVKPNILDKDREKMLSKIATRGVVQLFNAVGIQQKDIDNRLQQAGSLERNRDRAMKSIDKRQFLNVLMGEKSQPVDGPVKAETGDRNTDSVTSPATWNVLRDDFMMGGKLKDWDKEFAQETNEIATVQRNTCEKLCSCHPNCFNISISP